MRKRAITDQRLKNRKFRQIEDAILKVYIRTWKRDVTVVDVARQLGVARSTIYRHHKTMKSIIYDYEKYILQKYKAFVGRYIQKDDVTVRELMRRTLFFILMHKSLFKMMMDCGGGFVVGEMLDCLKGKILREYRLPLQSNKIFRIYKNELMGLVEEWRKTDFSEVEINSVLKDIIYLTNTLRIRLGPLEK